MIYQLTPSRRSIHFDPIRHRKASRMPFLPVFLLFLILAGPFYSASFAAGKQAGKIGLRNIPAITPALPTPTMAVTSTPSAGKPKVLWIVKNTMLPDTLPEHTCDFNYYTFREIFTSMGAASDALIESATELTVEQLRGYSAVIIDADPYFELIMRKIAYFREVLYQYVSQGGSLFITCSNMNNSFASIIAQPYGIAFSKKTSNYASNFISHPLLYNVQEFNTASGNILEVSSPAQVLGRDKAQNPVLTISTLSSGRVAALSYGNILYSREAAFPDRFGIAYSSHRRFAKNLAAWLLHKEDTIPAPFTPTPTYSVGPSDPEALQLFKKVLETNSPWLNPKPADISYTIKNDTFKTQDGGTSALRVGSILYTPLHIISHKKPGYSVKTLGNTIYNNIPVTKLEITMNTVIQEHIGMGGQGDVNYAYCGDSVRAFHVYVDPQKAIPLFLGSNNVLFQSGEPKYTITWEFSPDFYALDGGYAPREISSINPAFQEKQTFQVVDGIWIYKIGNSSSGVTIELTNLSVKPIEETVPSTETPTVTPALPSATATPTVTAAPIPGKQKVLWIVKNKMLPATLPGAPCESNYYTFREIFTSMGVASDALIDSATELTIEQLRGYSAVIIHPDSLIRLISRKIEYLRDELYKYVSEGGSLFITCSSSYNDFASVIAQPYGINFSKKASFSASNFISHPLLNNVLTLRGSSGSILEVTSPAQVLGSDQSQNPVLAISTLSSGRVVALPYVNILYSNETAIPDKYGITNSFHMQFAKNLAAWLLHKEDTIPAPYTPTPTITPTPTYSEGLSDAEGLQLFQRVMKANVSWLNPKSAKLSYDLLRNQSEQMGHYEADEGGIRPLRVGSIFYTPLHSIYYYNQPYSVKSLGNTIYKGTAVTVLQVTSYQSFYEEIGLGGQEQTSYAHDGNCLLAFRLYADPIKAIPLFIGTSTNPFEPDQKHYNSTWEFSTDFYELDGGYAPHEVVFDGYYSIHERQTFQVSNGVWHFQSGESWYGEISIYAGKPEQTIELVNLAVESVPVTTQPTETPTATPTPALPSATPTPTPTEVSLPADVQIMTVTTYIDGSDLLHIKGSEVWFEHLDYNLPGLTWINNQLWGNNISSHFKSLTPALPQTDGYYYSLKVKKARGGLSLVQEPSASNQYEAVLLFDDLTLGAADWYEAELRWSKTPFEPSFPLPEPPYIRWQGAEAAAALNDFLITIQGKTLECQSKSKVLTSSVLFSEPLPQKPVNISAAAWHSDVTTEILEQPRLENQYTAKIAVRFSNPFKNPGMFRIDFSWKDGVQYSTVTPWQTFVPDQPTPTPNLANQRVLWIAEKKSLLDTRQKFPGVYDYYDFREIFTAMGAASDVQIAGSAAITLEKLNKYSAVLFGGTSKLPPISAEEQDAIVRYVRNGGSIFVLGRGSNSGFEDKSSLYTSSITKPFGITFHNGSSGNLVTFEYHPLLNSVQYLKSVSSGILEVTSPAQVIARGRNAVPLLAAANPDFGRVAVFAAESVFTSNGSYPRYDIGEIPHTQFAKNLAAWLLRKDIFIPSVPSPTPAPTFSSGLSDAEGMQLLQKVLETNAPWFDPKPGDISYKLFRNQSENIGAYTIHNGGNHPVRVGSIVYTPLHILYDKKPPYSVISMGNTVYHGRKADVLQITFERTWNEEIGMGGQGNTSYSHGGFPLRAFRLYVDPEKAIPLFIGTSQIPFEPQQKTFISTWEFSPDFYALDGGYVPREFTYTNDAFMRERQIFQVVNGIWIYRLGEAYFAKSSLNEGDLAQTIELTDLTVEPITTGIPRWNNY